MTELGFLVELFLNHKLSKSTKEAIAARIKEVEENSRNSPNIAIPAAPRQPANLPAQAPSTLAAMAKHGIISPDPSIPMPPIEEGQAPQQPVQVAQTLATALAMQSRTQAIQDSINGKMTGDRPRKF